MVLVEHPLLHLHEEVLADQVVQTVLTLILLLLQVEVLMVVVEEVKQTTQLLIAVLVEQFVLFGLDQHVHSHQLALAILN
jgi:hypothetical protein